MFANDTLQGRMALITGGDTGIGLEIANAARNLFEVGARRLGGSANLDAMVGLYESMAGVGFADA